MARPEKIRRVGCSEWGGGFKPIGIPVDELEVEILRLDELEALRLADLEGLYQEAAAERMDVSRPTFARILGRARSIVARVLVQEKMLVIGNGPVEEKALEPMACPVHDGDRRRGRDCRCPHRGEQAFPKPESTDG